MTKTILAATDGSGHAERAVEVAAAIADLYNAKLILAHVLPDIVNEHLPEHLEKLVEFERLDIGEALNSIGQSILDRAQQEARKQGVKDIETVLTTDGEMTIWSITNRNLGTHIPLLKQWTPPIQRHRDVWLWLRTVLTAPDKPRPLFPQKQTWAS
jgi:hypothetical protein